MLERAPGCLEHGGRHLLSLSKKSLRSQRSLHSTFFCHGAGDIDLPSWWIELLQKPPPEGVGVVQSITDTARKCISAGLADGGFLDFLYPAKTLILIHKLAIRDASYARNRNQVQTNHYASRPYTSEASETRLAVESDHDHAMELLDTIQQNDRRSAAPILKLSVRRRKPQPISVLKRDRIWHFQSLERQLRRDEDTLGICSGRVKRRDILSSLSDLRQSHRTGIELSKAFARALLELLPETGWQARHYNSAIRATFLLDDKARALELYKKALRIGLRVSHTIFELSITNEAWPFLAKVSGVHSLVEGGSLMLTDHLRSMGPKYLFQKGSSLLNYIQHNNSANPHLHLLFVAANLMEQFLRSPMDPRIELRYYNYMWSRLCSCMAPTEWHYQKTMTHLLSVSGQKSFIAPFTVQALRIWSSIRKDESIQIDSDSLMGLFKRSCHLHQPQAKKVFEDWRARFGTPPPLMFHYILREKAHQGDLQAFKMYLGQLEEFHGTRERLRYLVLLIQIHGRRKELSDAIKVFDSIRSEYGLPYDESCWSAIMEAHSKVGDVHGVVQYYNRMIASGISADLNTLTKLLRVWANRGDMRAVEKVSSVIGEKGISLDAALIDTLVRGYIRNEDLEAAGRVVIDALNMDFQGSRTNMWNMLINAHAVRGELQQVYTIHGRMIQARVPEDELTYAALMQSFSSACLPLSALSILRKVMPKKKIQASALHYTIAMAAFLQTAQYSVVLDLYKSMLSSGPNPDLCIETLMLKAAAELDVATQREARRAVADAEMGIESTENFVLTRAEALLDRLLGIEDPEGFSTHGPVHGQGRQPLKDFAIANYLDHLIVLYGQAEAFDKVAELYNYYSSSIRSSPNNPASYPPLKMLSALMISHLNQGHFDDVKRCWELALSEAWPRVQRDDAVSSKSNWAPYSRRHLLCIPLFWYMRSLVAQNCTEDIDPVIGSVHRAGYILDNKCWNYYVQVVAQSGRILQAFRTAETQLIGGSHGSNDDLSKRQDRARRLQDRLLYPNTLAALVRSYSEWEPGSTRSDIKQNNVVGLCRELHRVAPMVLSVVQKISEGSNDITWKYLWQPQQEFEDAGS